MNIFFLSWDPVEAAQQQNNKHVNKMLIETSQLLSTAHRLLDGELYYGKTANGRNIKRWYLDDFREQVLYKATHVNHPCAQWVRETSGNYDWAYRLFVALCDEFVHRSTHKCTHETDRKLRDILALWPDNITDGELTEPPQAMPDKYKVPGDPVMAYKNYYIGEKASFSEWTNRPIPSWFNDSGFMEKLKQEIDANS